MSMPDDWPNRTVSRFVPAAGLQWHVQELGYGPTALLIHGTGASSHSWRDVLPLLATRFRVIAPDLPGHGFTSTPAYKGFALPSMAQALSELTHVLGATPAVVVGHSAGAAVLVRMTLDGLIEPAIIISINGALLPLEKFPRWLFAPMARLLARAPLIPDLIARRAKDVRSVERLIADTGSHLDQSGIRLYQSLFERPSHVAAAFSMMASWDLERLARDIPRLRTPLYLLTALGDRTIPPGEAERVCTLSKQATIEWLEGLGHLAHEEQPQAISADMVRLATAAGALTASALPLGH